MMNKFSNRMMMAATLAGLLFMAACSTPQEGVTDEAGTYSTRIAAKTEAVTAAAKSVLEELKLDEIKVKSTMLDGQVTAKTAQGDVITIEIERETDAITDVEVKVGTWGDQATSLTILEKLKAKFKS